MLNDNWHKRFGKMWVVIIIIGVCLFIEIECVTCMNQKILNLIEDKEIEIYMLKESQQVDNLMIDYLLQSPRKQRTFHGHFNLNAYINKTINQDVK